MSIVLPPYGRPEKFCPLDLAEEAEQEERRSAEACDEKNEEEENEAELSTVAIEPAWVALNVYWFRSVSYDENGRVMRQSVTGGFGPLSWGRRFMKDLAGIYHVGVEVHGHEYTFGNYHAPSYRQVGGPDSGVCAHTPTRAGPHLIFKQAVKLGTTDMTAAEANDWAGHFGRGDFSKASYSRLDHNCVDFSRRFLARLGADEPPSWCCRTLSVARFFGVAGGDDGGANVRFEACRPVDTPDAIILDAFEDPSSCSSPEAGSPMRLTRSFALDLPPDSTPPSYLTGLEDIGSTPIAGASTPPSAEEQSPMLRSLRWSASRVASSLVLGR